MQVMAPAHSIEQLHSQLEELFNDVTLKELYKSANKTLDQMAIVTDHFGPFSISNYQEIVPGINRSATPTMSQARSLVESGEVNHIVALNMELGTLTQMDPGSGVPLTEERKNVMREKFLARGKSVERANHEIEFYEQNLEYAQGVSRQSLPYTSYFPLDQPSNTIAGYFEALERIRELRHEKKKVLLHCSVGKHRTGLMAMLIKVLNQGGSISNAQKLDLYFEFIDRNWNEEAASRIQHMFALPLIVKSAPFQRLASKWN